MAAIGHPNRRFALVWSPLRQALRGRQYQGYYYMSAYLVLDFAIHDFEEFSEYIREIPQFIEKHLGRYIVRGEEPTVIEGD